MIEKRVEVRRAWMMEDVRMCMLGLGVCSEMMCARGWSETVVVSCVRPKGWDEVDEVSVDVQQQTKNPSAFSNHPSLFITSHVFKALSTPSVRLLIPFGASGGPVMNSSVQSGGHRGWRDVRRPSVMATVELGLMTRRVNGLRLRG